MFSARVHVILIPSITEYEAAGLASSLWWGDDDYKDFKQSALQEVKDYMVEKSISDSKEAIRILYQNMESNDLELVVAAEEMKRTQDLEHVHAESLQPPNESSSTNQALETPKLEGTCDSKLFNFKRFGFLIRSHSFCVNPETSKPIFNDPEITSFRSKTDVDIIHDKSTETAARDFFNKLRKLHVDKSKHTPDRVEEQIHPLALICS